MSVPEQRLLGMGVDGAPGGWVAVCSFGSDPDVGPEHRRSEPRFFPSIAALHEWRDDQPGSAAAPVAVDIPIGLPDTVSFPRRGPGEHAHVNSLGRYDLHRHPPPAGHLRPLRRVDDDRSRAALTPPLRVSGDKH